MVSTALSKSEQSAIDRHLTTIDKAKTDMVNGAVIIGTSLLAVREILPKPAFVPWVEENCGFSKTTAYRYCEVAEVFGKFPKIENFQDSALYVLAKCEAAATKAKAMASRGKRITHEMAQEIVKEVKAEEESHSQIGNEESEVIDVKSVPVSEAPEIEGELVEPEAASAPAPAPPADPPPEDEPPAGGYEPEEARKPLKTLAELLAKSARACAECRLILGNTPELNAVYSGIDSATVSLTKFRANFNRKTK